MTQVNAIGAALSSGPLDPKWFSAWYDTEEEAVASKARHDATYKSELSRASASVEAEFDLAARHGRGG
jgi:hypothetical protein